MGKKINVAYLRMDVVEELQKNIAPRCYYCGMPYKKDKHLTTEKITVWMPGCECINKPTIRIATGGSIEFEEEDSNE